MVGVGLFAPRKGAVNALDDEDFVKTIRATGRKTLIVAGIWTDVCVICRRMTNATGSKAFRFVKRKN